MANESSSGAEGGRLESWKEIASHLGRDVRTVQRWEQGEGLPVHRLHHKKLGSVYANASEIDAWLKSRQPETQPTKTTGRDARLFPWRRILTAAALLASAVALGAGTARLWLKPAPAPRAETALTGRNLNLLAALRPVKPEVYESYLQGRYRLNQGSRAEVEESVRHFERAIRVDPTFAPAHAGLATAYSAFGGTSVAISSVADVRPKAEAAARKALKLDPNEVTAHLALARLMQQEWEWDEAESEYRKALELDPNNASAYSSFAQMLLWTGRTEEAVALGRRARLLDPLSFRNGAALGWIYYHARRYYEAIRELETVLAVEPNRFGPAWFLGFALIDAGRPEEAIQVLERTGARFGRTPALLGVLTRAYAVAGRREDAARVLAELEGHRSAGYVPPASLVNAYVGVGDHEQAFIWLERAYQEHSNLIQFLSTHPMLDPLRKDPRFSDLIRRARLS